MEIIELLQLIPIHKILEGIGVTTIILHFIYGLSNYGVLKVKNLKNNPNKEKDSTLKSLRLFTYCMLVGVLYPLKENIYFVLKNVDFRIKIDS